MTDFSSDSASIPTSGTWTTQQVTRLFFLAITTYFLAQLALRLILGGALETDEAEMLLMTPGLRWGYGPQLPLYNWLQTVLFSVFGETLFALSLLKNLLLWSTYALLFVGLRAFVPARVAALTALSLFLIPDIAWEAERATTHSNMLLATISASIATFLWALKTGHLRHWALFGLALGLGGIAKYNFWAIPVGLVLASLSIEHARRSLLSKRALIAPVIAAIVVAGPYVWMFKNPDLALSSVGKMDLSEAAHSLIPEGVPLYFQGIAALLILPALVAVILWIASRKRSASVDTRWPAILFLRAGAILAVIGLATVWLAEVGHITPRWLLPIVLPVVIGLFLHLSPRLSRRAALGYLITLCLFAVLVFVGLTFDRYKDGARRDLDFEPLAQFIEEMNLPEDTLIVADFYIGGNLAHIRPDWSIRPDLPANAKSEQTKQILLLSRTAGKGSHMSKLASQVGWPFTDHADYGEERQITLPFLHGKRTLPVRLLYGTSQ
ncbi:ArnT family glycosyltransferase [Celeribacter halophilus]|uniref:ArnT family glycosyltransferase n=1 Tax=Celeribacter halophilus TaxID=576117 RepID=UPI003A90F70E